DCDPDPRADPPRRAFALRRPAPAPRSAGAHEARGLSLALCALRAHDRDAADRLGDAIGGGISGGDMAGRLAAADPAAGPQPPHAALERAFLSRLPVLRPDLDASRRRAVPRADPTRRCVR